MGFVKGKLRNVEKARNALLQDLKRVFGSQIYRPIKYTPLLKMMLRDTLIVRYKGRIFRPIITESLFYSIAKAVREEDIDRDFDIKYILDPSLQGKLHLRFNKLLTFTTVDYYFLEKVKWKR